MNRNERRKYLKSLGLDDSAMRMMEEAQRISDMFEPYRESLLRSFEVMEEFRRSHLGVFENIAERYPAFLEFNNSKAVSDLVARKWEFERRQTRRAQRRSPLEAGRS